MISIVESVSEQHGEHEIKALFEAMNLQPTGRTKSQLHKKLIKLLKDKIVSRSKVDGIRDM